MGILHSLIVLINCISSKNFLPLNYNTYGKEKIDYVTFKKEVAEHLKNGRSMIIKDGVFIPLYKEFYYYSYLSYEKAN
jgi:hypothetical protein